MAFFAAFLSLSISSPEEQLTIKDHTFKDDDRKAGLRGKKRLLEREVGSRSKTSSTECGMWWWVKGNIREVGKNPPEAEAEEARRKQTQLAWCVGENINEIDKRAECVCMCARPRA